MDPNFFLPFFTCALCTIFITIPSELLLCPARRTARERRLDTAERARERTLPGDAKLDHRPHLRIVVQLPAREQRGVLRERRRRRVDQRREARALRLGEVGATGAVEAVVGQRADGPRRLVVKRRQVG